MSETDLFYRLRPQPATPADEICSCPDSTPFVLMSALSANPVHCLRCNLEVPLRRLVFSDVRLVDQIADWNSVWSALDRLWLDSGAYENFARGEMERLDSSANAQGLAAAARLRDFHPTFYHAFRDESNGDVPVPKICPGCERDLRPVSGSNPSRAVCDRCYLAVFVIAP